MHILNRSKIKNCLSVLSLRP